MQVRMCFFFFKFISLLRNKIFQVFMAVVQMRVVFWVCTNYSVVPYVPSVSMLTTSDTEEGGSTSIQSARTWKENASQCRTPKDNCHSSNKFACMRPLSFIHSKAQHYVIVSSQPLTLHPHPQEWAFSNHWIGGLVGPRCSYIFWRGERSLLLVRSNPTFVQPIA